MPQITYRKDLREARDNMVAVAPGIEGIQETPMEEGHPLEIRFFTRFAYIDHFHCTELIVQKIGEHKRTSKLVSCINKNRV